MTPYQLDESANAPCTRTMVGLVGCAVAAAPVSKRPTDVRIAANIFILKPPLSAFSQGPGDAGRRAIEPPGLLSPRRCRRRSVRPPHRHAWREGPGRRRIVCARTFHAIAVRFLFVPAMAACTALMRLERN